MNGVLNNNESMKVLHITNNFPTENYPIFGIFVKEQIDSLTAQGIDNEIFFINGREGGKSAYIESLRKLRKKLSFNNYDIIHCHHSLSALIFLLTFNFFKFKKIISYQNDPEREGGKYLFKIMKILFDGIILKNINEKKLSKKIFYLPNGVNTDFFIPMDKSECVKKLHLNTDKKYILFFDSNKGKRTQKRYDRFLEVMEILKEKGYQDTEGIILTNTKRELIPYYMNVAELHLLCSDFEGSPNSVKECISCNVPVVSTPVGNVNDLIGDISGCYISKTFEPDELADLCIKVFQDKESKFDGRNNFLSKQLDTKSVAKKLINIYNTVS